MERKEIIKAMEEHASQFQSPRLEITDSDVESIAIELKHWTRNNIEDNIAIIDLQNIIKWLLFRINSDKEKEAVSDAIKFAEWISKEEWAYDENDKDWYDPLVSKFKSTSELYHIFKTSEK